MIEHKSILVREADMAKLLGISTPYMIKLRNLRKVPFLQIGKSVRYDPYRVKEVLQKYAVEEEV